MAIGDLVEWTLGDGSYRRGVQLDDDGGSAIVLTSSGDIVRTGLPAIRVAAPRGTLSANAATLRLPEIGGPFATDRNRLVGEADRALNATTTRGAAPATTAGTGNS